MYNQDKNFMKPLVEKALEGYKNDPTDTSKGYDIIRYVNQRLIASNASAQEFLDFYPLNPAYIILRLAKEGKLSYKEQD